MTSWVVVQLDTIPPSFSVGSATVSDGQLVIPYTLSDGTIDAVLELDGEFIVGTISVGEITFDLPTGASGTAELTVTATDDVLNSLSHSAAITVSGETPPVQQTIGGSTGEEIYGGGPWMRPFEQSIPASTTLRREVEFRVPGRATLRARPRLSQTVRGSAHLSREFEVTFSGHRNEAVHWARTLAEDEEILALL